MIPNRIEAYCELSRFAYLREVAGHLPRSEDFADAPVIVAEELDGDGGICRTWFVMVRSRRDGAGLTAVCPPSRIVSRDIRPGEVTPDYDPNAEPKIEHTYGEPELIKVRRSRNEMLADRERHVVYAHKYTDAISKAEGWKSNVEHLNSVVSQKDDTIKQRDDEIVRLKNESALDRLQIATLQASYLELEKRKSLIERVKTWFRSKLNNLRGCQSRHAE